MKKSNLLFILVVLSITACTKQNQQPQQQPQQVNDTIFAYRTVDGCTWLIQLPGGSFLEPINLSDFNVTPAEGKKISITYTLSSNASICMMGQMIKLTSLKEK